MKKVKTSPALLASFIRGEEVRAWRLLSRCGGVEHYLSPTVARHLRMCSSSSPGVMLATITSIQSRSSRTCDTTHSVQADHVHLPSCPDDPQTTGETDGTSKPVTRGPYHAW